MIGGVCLCQCNKNENEIMMEAVIGWRLSATVICVTKVHADQLTSGESSAHVQVFSEYALYLLLNVRFNVSGLL